MMKYPYTSIFLLLIICILPAKNTYSLVHLGKNNKPMVVVIDPGHGGKDPGAIGKGVREKDIVLGIGLKLGQYINDNFSDVKVVYTRNTDVFVPLIERSRIANKCKADLFISLHANSCTSLSTRGTETFFLGVARSDDNLDVAKKENSVILLEDGYKSTYEGFDPNLSESYIMFELVQDAYLDQSLSFADAIQHQFQRKLNTTNRGVKQAGFLVLRQSSMPSVLVEVGFVSNQNEANQLCSEEGQRNIAISILDAFRKFKSKNNSTGSHQATVASKSEEVANDVVKEQKPEPKNIEKPIAESPKVVAVTKNVTKEKAAHADVPSAKSVVENSTYFCVQIGAGLSPEEPTPAHFKGLKDIRREKSDKYYRYYVGKEVSLEKITPLLKQIKRKFPAAFIVSFVDGKRVITKK